MSRGVLREGFGLLGSRLQGVIHPLFRIVLSSAKELDEFEEEGGTKSWRPAL